VPLTPRLLIDDMLSLKQAAIGGLGIVALLVTFVATMCNRAYCGRSYPVGSQTIRR
jgi:hypothetical protein